MAWLPSLSGPSLTVPLRGRVGQRGAVLLCGFPISSMSLEIGPAPESPARIMQSVEERHGRALNLDRSLNGVAHHVLTLDSLGIVLAHILSFTLGHFGSFGLIQLGLNTRASLAMYSCSATSVNFSAVY